MVMQGFEKQTQSDSEFKVVVKQWKCPFKYYFGDWMSLRVHPKANFTTKFIEKWYYWTFYRRDDSFGDDRL